MSAVLAPPAPAAATPPPVGPVAPVANPLGLPLQALAAGLRRFSVAEYHAMIAAGVLSENDRVELLAGYVVNKMPQNTPHRITVNRLRKALDAVKPADWNSQIQGPISLGASEPEPDYCIYRGDDADPLADHPGPAVIGLLAEVADSSLAGDRADKQQAYAAAGIPVYWIVNLPEKQVEVYTDPRPAADPPGYATRTDYRAGAAVPVVLDGAAVAAVPVAELLP